jgi:hypothetical protein
MLAQWALRGVPHQLWLNDARRLTLALLDENVRLFVGNLKIGYAKRFPLVNRHVAEAITQIIKPCFQKFSALSEPPFFNREDHAAPFIMPRTPQDRRQKSSREKAQKAQKF